MIKRYDPVTSDSVVASHDGLLVEYSEYQKLLEKYEKLKRELTND